MGSDADHCLWMPALSIPTHFTGEFSLKHHSQKNRISILPLAHSELSFSVTSSRSSRNLPKCRRLYSRTLLSWNLICNNYSHERTSSFTGIWIPPSNSLSTFEGCNSPPHLASYAPDFVTKDQIVTRVTSLRNVR